MSLNGWNAEFVEERYREWKADPESVEADWRRFFEGFELGAARPEPGETAVAHSLQGKVDSLIYHYRDIGHLAADLDPLDRTRPFPENLTLESFGLGDEHLDETFDPGVLPLESPAPLRDIIALLEATYCRHIGAEYMHIQDREKRRWLQKRMEGVSNQPPRSEEDRIHLLETLASADAFETFLQTRYVGKKRFGIEGGESLIPLLDTIIELAPANGINEFVMGMSHRGRLNVLCNILGKTYGQLFTEFAESWEEDFIAGTGDVKYHGAYSGDRTTRSGQKVRLALAANPSHLEFVDPIVLGRCRAKQRLRDDDAREQVVPLLMHGDAAFAGQGIVAECFNMMKLDGYTVGGTLHVIVNNQIGFTTEQTDSFSGRYGTDIAKMIDAPIFHVNGDDPEAVAWVARLAVEYRQAFHNDVVIDMWCYRRRGHNEADEPKFTQPVMYDRIKAQPSVAKIYRDQLVAEGIVDEGRFVEMQAAYMKVMDEAQAKAEAEPEDPRIEAFGSLWEGLTDEYDITSIETGIDRDTFDEVFEGIERLPEGFAHHRTLKRGFENRRKLFKSDEIEWATGEALAFGSLLLEGHPIRLTGQDVERGTFSHRHMVVHDQKTAARHMPINEIREGQAKFCVHNSPLTEQACLGFEYGYSLTDPRMLIIWEAQFGDFVNGAQVIVDQFIASAEKKWERSSGLALFLPHGNEGLGPEHSSARLERFLQLSADENMVVCSPTRASQIFHLIRRQMNQSFRKPLIVMSPKSMLRLPASRSPISRFLTGGYVNVIDDTRFDESGGDRDAVRQVILCSGKVYYDLANRRDTVDRKDVAMVRLEQIAPFPAGDVKRILDRYPNHETVTWVQEEPRNHGAFYFVDRSMREMLEIEIEDITRVASPSPSGGSTAMHEQEQQEIVLAAIDGGLDRKPRGDAASKKRKSGKHDARKTSRSN
ncbi:MAG: 2-oxoglutarate dehydrogenase E1 component [Phycisphaeraceae bacterium]|nr:2-oxoglutarate dehydrogenase E1 component [Phycisphaeraceae bacterium]MCP4067258.1 2-oxoglutarate dehydrogenase E1 component [Phycisphaeraceae bacterium]MCP4797670.1 2-oxoglutarate dehydrogenase E1 component [Phycisphaeraceae bacterium]MCP4939071.1 2-oxoglutarate dehydrogenase E1 component [Phycisphaeraceae bacterium]